MEKPIYVGCDDSGFEAKQTVLRVLEELGFAYVTLDMAGYRMGSQNEG